MQVFWAKSHAWPRRKLIRVGTLQKVGHAIPKAQNGILCVYTYIRSWPTQIVVVFDGTYANTVRLWWCLMEHMQTQSDCGDVWWNICKHSQIVVMFDETYAYSLHDSNFGGKADPCSSCLTSARYRQVYSTHCAVILRYSTSYNCAHVQLIPACTHTHTHTNTHTHTHTDMNTPYSSHVW